MPCMRRLWLGCRSFTLESDPEAAGAAEPFLPGLSTRVASQPLVDDREDGMHQGQGRSRTWQQGCSCSGTQSSVSFSVLGAQRLGAVVKKLNHESVPFGCRGGSFQLPYNYLHYPCHNNSSLCL